MTGTVSMAAMDSLMADSITAYMDSRTRDRRLDTVADSMVALADSMVAASMAADSMVAASMAADSMAALAASMAADSMAAVAADIWVVWVVVAGR